MRKKILLIGSLLAVSAVASAKEVVAQPKVAPEVQVKEIIKEVPVEKVVYRDVKVEKFKPTGNFEVSYEVPFYNYDFGKDNVSFSETQRIGTLVTKAEVEVAPKHKVRAEAEASLELIPYYVKTEKNDDSNKENGNGTIIFNPDVEDWESGEGTEIGGGDQPSPSPEENEVTPPNPPAPNPGNEGGNESGTEEGGRVGVDDWETEEIEIGMRAMPDNVAPNAKSTEDTLMPAHIAGINKMLVGYNYKHNDLVSFDAEFEIKNDGMKSIKVGPTFDVKSYIPENDYLKFKEVSLTPSYKYTWKQMPAEDYLSNHELSLSGKVALVGSYETEFGLDLKDFVKWHGEYAPKSDAPDKYEFTSKTTGNAEIYAKKGFNLYDSGKHKVNLDIKAGYGFKEFAYSDNAKYYLYDKDGKEVMTSDNKKEKVRLNTDKLYVKPALTYTYKINDYSKLYTTLDAEFAGVKKYTIKDSDRDWSVKSNITAGLKVEF